MLGHNIDPARPGGLAGGHVPAAGRARVGAERGRGSHGVRTILIDAGMGMEFPDLPRAGKFAQRLKAAGIDPASVTDVVLTHMHMDHCGGLLADGMKERLRPDLRIHLAAAEAEFWESPDFSRVSMPPGFPDALRRTGKRFLKEYHSQMRTFENEYEVAPGVVVQRTGGHAGRRGPPGVRRGPADVRWRRRVPGRVRAPRLVQRLRTRPRGGGPRPGPSSAGAGGEPRVAGGHSPVVPVRSRSTQERERRRPVLYGGEGPNSSRHSRSLRPLRNSQATRQTGSGRLPAPPPNSKSTAHISRKGSASSITCRASAR